MDLSQIIKYRFYYGVFTLKISDANMGGWGPLSDLKKKEGGKFSLLVKFKKNEGPKVL